MTVQEFAAYISSEVGKVILGKQQQTELILTALLAEGHVLLDDLPGVGKTTLVKTFARASGCTAGRIQFVPDLMPADITGMSVYDRQTGNFRLMKGPVFCNILLADEINRAVPRTQSALLEAMEEKTVTIDGESLRLPAPFMVLATQNPVESESTFRLPAAQMDRFLFRISLGYPNAQQEKQMLSQDEIGPEHATVIGSPEMILSLRNDVKKIHVADSVAEYIVAITAATREKKGVTMGAGPRATKALYRAAKALAAIRGRAIVTPDDIQYLVPYVLTHRILLSGEQKMAGITASQVLSEILSAIPVPPARLQLFNE